VGEEDQAEGLAIAVLCMGAREPDCRKRERGDGAGGTEEGELTRAADTKDTLHNVQGAGALGDRGEADKGIF